MSFSRIIILRRMLINSRAKLTNKRISSCLSNPNPILASNPEIQVLVDRLMLISESVPEERPKTLNLIEWQKQRYRPTENENRIRIQNHISMIKVCNERVRSRIKPIKRAHSIDLSHHHPLPYKQHYEQIKKGNDRKISIEDESEEEPESPYFAFTEEEQPKGGIRYFQSLKKYNKIVQFINGRIDSQSEKACQQKSRLRSANSQSVPGSPTLPLSSSPMKKHSSMVEKEKVVRLGDKQSNNRVSSIVKKWRPQSKIERIFSSTAESRKNTKRQLVWGEQNARVSAREPSRSRQASLASSEPQEHINLPQQPQK